MIMQVRSKSHSKKVCGKQVMIPKHTVLLSVENHDIFMFSKQNTRTFLRKLEKAGYVRCYVTEKKLGTFVEILESEIYKRYESSSLKKQKEVVGSEFEEMKNRLKKL